MLERVLNKIFEETKPLYIAIEIGVDESGEIIFLTETKNFDLESEELDKKICEAVYPLLTNFNDRLINNLFYYPKRNAVEVRRPGKETLIYHLQTKDKIFTEILNICEIERGQQ